MFALTKKRMSAAFFLKSETMKKLCENNEVETTATRQPCPVSV